MSSLCRLNGAGRGEATGICPAALPQPASPRQPVIEAGGKVAGQGRWCQADGFLALPVTSRLRRALEFLKCRDFITIGAIAMVNSSNSALSPSASALISGMFAPSARSSAAAASMIADACAKSARRLASSADHAGRAAQLDRDRHFLR